MFTYINLIFLVSPLTHGKLDQGSAATDVIKFGLLIKSKSWLPLSCGWCVGLGNIYLYEPQLSCCQHGNCNNYLAGLWWELEMMKPSTLFSGVLWWLLSSKNWCHDIEQMNRWTNCFQNKNFSSLQVSTSVLIYLWQKGRPDYFSVTQSIGTRYPLKRERGGGT